MVLGGDLQVDEIGTRRKPESLKIKDELGWGNGSTDKSACWEAGQPEFYPQDL